MLEQGHAGGHSNVQPDGERVRLEAELLGDSRADLSYKRGGTSLTGRLRSVPAGHGGLNAKRAAYHLG